jgi:RNA polymerase sigma-70 factor (ECF subfamily)
MEKSSKKLRIRMAEASKTALKKCPPRPIFRRRRTIDRIQPIDDNGERPFVDGHASHRPPIEVRPLAVRTETFRDFYREHAHFVWRASRRLGVDDAAVDDVVQHVFLVAFRRLSDVRPEDFPEGSGRAWLFAILARVVQEHRRKTRRKSPHTILPHTDPETLADPRQVGPHEAVARLEAARLAQRLLDRLDEGRRAIFVLAEVEQFTTGEIAHALGLNEDTVSSRLRAARRDFRRAAARWHRRDTWKSG